MEKMMSDSKQEYLQFLEAGLASAESVHGSEHPNVLAPLNAAAEFHLFHGKHQRAEELLLRAVAIAEGAEGNGPESLKLAKQKLAWLSYLQSDMDKAESYLMQAVDVITQSAPENEEGIAQAIRSLVYFLIKTEKFKEAEAALHNLLNVYQVHGKDSNYQSAFVYIALAVVSDKRMDAEMARSYLDKAAGIIKDKCAIGYTVDFLSLSEIINLYFSQERKAEALELAACTMLESEDSFWPHNPIAADALSCLAEYMRGQRKFKQAEAIYKRALAIKEFSHGQDSAEYGNLCLNLGNMYLGLRKYADAEPYVKAALKARVKCFGAEHPSVAACVETYATILRRTKRVALANKLDMRAREIRSVCVDRLTRV